MSCLQIMHWQTTRKIRWLPRETHVLSEVRLQSEFDTYREEIFLIFSELHFRHNLVDFLMPVNSKEAPMVATPKPALKVEPTGVNSFFSLMHFSHKVVPQSAHLYVSLCTPLPEKRPFSS